MQNFKDVTPHKWERTRMLLSDFKIFSSHFPDRRIFGGEEGGIMQLTFGRHYTINSCIFNTPLYVFEELNITVSEYRDWYIRSEVNKRQAKSQVSCYLFNCVYQRYRDKCLFRWLLIVISGKRARQFERNISVKWVWRYNDWGYPFKDTYNYATIFHYILAN